MQLIRAGRINTPVETIDNGVLLVDGGRIVAVGARELEAAYPHVTVLDATTLTVAPGFIDIHTHGGGGHSPLLEEDDGSVASIARFYARHGVTGFLAAAWGTQPQIERALDRAVRFIAQPAPQDGAAALGFYLEGPFLSPEFPGAFHPESIVAPDPALLAAYIARAAGHLRLLTLAPERPGADALVALAQRHGVVCAAGHTGARYEEMARAAEMGVRHATHTFNAMSPLHHRAPGAIGAVLEDSRWTAEIIADGIHVHPAAVRLLVHTKGPDRCVLITDSILAAGMADGVYDLPDGAIIVADGSARLADGTLAGSVLTMDAGVGNLVAMGAATLSEALTMASRTPAVVLGLGDRKGTLAPGYDADLVAFESDGNRLTVVWTMVGGQIVYRRADEGAA